MNESVMEPQPAEGAVDVPQGPAPRDRPRRILDLALPLCMAFAYLALLIATSSDTGYVRDEGYYFSAADSYNGWFTELWQGIKRGELGPVFSEPTIRKHWENNHEHPVLVKSLMALSWRWLHQGMGVNQTLAFRLPPMVMASAIVWVLYAFGLLLWNRRVAIAASLAWALMPRYFFHNHLACFDVPVVLFWLATAYAYLRAFHSRKWAWLTGVFFGLALATKLNSFFLPITFLLHWALTQGRQVGIWRQGRDLRLKLPPVPLAMVTMAILGPLIFFLHWPYIWHHTFARLGFYFGFHAKHVHYPTLYLGNLELSPPFPVSFPFGMTAFTVPLPTLLLFVLGSVLLLHQAVARGWLGRLMRLAPQRPSRMDDLPGAEVFLLLNALLPMAIIAFPSVPIFGGVKHWAHAMPFVALIAAAALDRALSPLMEALRQPWRRHLAAATAILLLAIPSALAVRYSHPYGMSYYSSLVGGMRGATELGLQRQWWGYASSGAIEWINAHAPQRARVYWHDTNFDAFNGYHRGGQLRQDIRYAASPDVADIAVMHYMKETMDTWYHAWRVFGSEEAVSGAYLDEVPLVQVFMRLGLLDR